MPIPGIYASQISGHLFSPSGAYDALASVTLSASATSVVFAGIPTGYKHLQLRVLAQGTRVTYGTGDLNIQLNGDTSSNYAFHYLEGDGSSPSASASTSNTYIFAGRTGTTTGGTFGGAIIDVLDYSNVNKYKTLRSLYGTDLNGTVGGVGGRAGLASGLWMSLLSINSITLTPSSSPFTQYSSFALYGVK
jgi:hypothetical protein